MKTTIALSIVLISFSLNMFAQDCSSGRYVSEVFTTLNVTSNIQYGENINLQGTNELLMLDVYEPVGDAMAERPLIIWAHGGSFISGIKTGPDVVPLAQDFAKMGYVTASMSYRLGMNGIPFPGPDSVDATETVIRAVHDARAAIRFFKKDFAENGNTYGIDTNNIFFGGVSAGGIMAVHLAYLDKENEIPTSYIDTSQAGLGGGVEGNSGNPGYRGNARAIINSSGALRDTAWMEAGDTPVISFHGDADATVPFGTDIISMLSVFPIMMIDGSRSIHERAENLGMNHCFDPWPGQDHVAHVSNAAYYDTLVTMSSNFLMQFVCGIAPICDYDFTACNLGITMTTTDEIASGSNGSATATVTIGTAPYTYLWSDGQTTSTASGLAAGTYSVTVDDADGCTTIMSATVDAFQCAATGAMSSSDESAVGAADGTATVSASGGQAPYVYSWNTGGTSSSITGLSPGIYDVTVTDAMGCVFTGSVAVNAAGCTLVLSMSGSDETSAGTNDGTATVVITGGTAPYAVLWSTTDTATDLSSLPPGTYSVSVSDNAGCFAAAVYTVAPGQVLGLLSHEQQEKLIRVFPNPARDLVTIVLENNASNATVQLYNAFGQKVRIDGNLEGTELTIKRGNLRSGIYFIKLVNDEGQYTARLIFE